MINRFDESVPRNKLMNFLFFSYLKDSVFTDYPRGNTRLPKSDRITVLIPCFGKSRFIENAVKSAVDQSMKPYEVIVLLMDDESIALKDKLSALGNCVRCVESGRMNVCDARSRLVSICETEYFIFLDGDDLLRPNFIETVYNNPNSVVFTPCYYERQDEKGFLYDFREDYKNIFIDNNMTGLLCKTVFNDAGGLNPAYAAGGEDTDFLMRLLLLKKYDIGIETGTYYIYTDADNGLTRNGSFFDFFVPLVNEYLDVFRDNIAYGYYDINSNIVDFLDNHYAVTEDDIIRFFFKDDSYKTMPRKEFLDRVYARIRNSRKQVISFILDLKCDRKCCYCVQNGERNRYKLRQTDDDIYRNFDRCLTYFEKLLGYPPTIQILGGEPTLWSDSLVTRILDRIKKYRHYVLFTNGYNKNSLWYKDKKAIIDWHIVDWTTCPTITPGRADRCHIIVTKKDIPYLDAFIKANRNNDIVISPCHDGGSDYDIDIDDIKRIALIEWDNRNILKNRPAMSFYDFYREKGMSACQNECRNHRTVWNVECFSGEVHTCCSGQHNVYRLEDFTGQKTTDCGDCLWYY